MFGNSLTLHARSQHGFNLQRYGSPGAPIIRAKYACRFYNQYRHYDLVVTYTHESYGTDRLLHYLGKHVPQPQKSLWSPDTPQPMDRHMFKLTSLDVDAFKYWFGVKRAQIDREAWKILMHSNLLPPSWWQRNPLVPAPIFDKEQLYKYYLKNRKSAEFYRKQTHVDWYNSMPRTVQERAADRPQAPWY